MNAISAGPLLFQLEGKHFPLSNLSLSDQFLRERSVGPLTYATGGQIFSNTMVPYNSGLFYQPQIHFLQPRTGLAHAALGNLPFKTLGNYIDEKQRSDYFLQVLEQNNQIKAANFFSAEMPEREYAPLIPTLRSSSIKLEDDNENESTINSYRFNSSSPVLTSSADYENIRSVTSTSVNHSLTAYELLAEAYKKQLVNPHSEFAPNQTSFKHLQTPLQEKTSPQVSLRRAYYGPYQNIPYCAAFGHQKRLQTLVHNSRIMANSAIHSADSQSTGKSATGKYSPEERALKIKYFKDKKKKWRTSHPVSRIFAGRRRVAQQKFRVKGKFVKGSSSLLQSPKSD